MEPIIEINNLYKEYQLGVIGRDTFYRDFQSFIAKLFKKEDPNTLLNSNISNNVLNKFLALKEINLKMFIEKLKDEKIKIDHVMTDEKNSRIWEDLFFKYHL